MEGLPTLRLAGIPSPPWVQRCFMSYPSQQCPYLGSEIEIIYKVLTILKFPVELREAADAEEMKLGLLNGTFDVGGITMSLADLSNHNQFGFSPIITDGKAVFVTRRTRKTSRKDSILIAVMDWEVWIAMLVLFLTHIIGRHFLRSSFLPELRLSQKMQKLSKAIWFFALAIVLGTYSNFLAIQLFKPPDFHPLFSNLDEYADLIKDGTCRIVLRTAMLKQATNFGVINAVIHPPNIYNEKPYDTIRESVINYPPKNVSDLHALADHVRKTDECYIGIVFSDTRRMMEKLFCGLKFLDLDTPRHPYAFIFRKSLQPLLGPLLSSFFNQGSAPDLYDRTDSAYSSREKREKCSDENQVDPFKKLSIFQLGEIFFLLHGVSFLAIGALLLEMASASRFDFSVISFRPWKKRD